MIVDDFIEIIFKRGLKEFYKLIVHPNLKINSYSKCHITPLHAAIKAKNFNMVEALLIKGSDPTMCNAKGNNALHYAAKIGCNKILELLLKPQFLKNNNDYNSYLNHPNFGGDTPLHYASRYSSIDIVKQFLNAGANLFILNKASQSPFHYAMNCNTLDIVNLLKETGNFFLQMALNINLFTSAFNNNYKNIILYVKWGAQIDATNIQGYTSLDGAIIKGNYIAVSQLLILGADYKSLRNGYSTIQLAELNGQYAIKHLIQYFDKKNNELLGDNLKSAIQKFDENNEKKIVQEQNSICIQKDQQDKFLVFSGSFPKNNSLNVASDKIQSKYDCTLSI